MMAVESATSNGADENSKLKEDKKGWLSKRTHFTHRWKTTWFQLKDTQLLYGQNEEVRSEERRFYRQHIKLIFSEL